MMKFRKFIAIILAVISVCSVLTACSGKEEETKPLTSEVNNVVDADDDTTMDIDSGEDYTIELTDKDGNVITLIPVYDCDGTTIIAGYVESAKDKNNKQLNAKAFSLLKKIVAIEKNEQSEFAIVYADDKAVVLDSVADKDGYIVAVVDKLDIDKNKNDKEYFEVETIIDKNGNVFIKLAKDEKGKRIVVELKTDKDGETSVTTSDGKKKPVNKTENSANLKDTADKVAQDSKKPTVVEDTTKKADKKPNDKKPSNSKPDDKKPEDSKPEDKKPEDNKPAPEQPGKKEYCSIVLGSGTDFEADCDNVKGKVNVATGTYEVQISNAGQYDKYVVTSKGNSTFTGKLEFQLRTTDEIEVKLIDLNISANAKTAVKFANLDRVVEKESDSEGDVNSEAGDAGTAVDVPAPKVELSFPEGTTSKIKANGSGNNGSIYSECKLGIKGYGKAEIDGGQNMSGICCTESIKIKNANLKITSLSKQGISCDKRVTIDSGTIDINSKGDAIHCNKFEMYGGKLDLKSLYSTECCDGIDSNDYIYIAGGKLNVVAVTPGKYALKVRKVLKENPKGYLKIDGGTVTASGGAGQLQTITGTQKTVFTYGSSQSKNTEFTVGNVKSVENAVSFICSPCNVNQVTVPTDAVKVPSQATKNIVWKSDTYGVAGAFILK